MSSTIAENYLRNKITDLLHVPVTSLDIKSIAGGSINDAARVVANEQHNFFLKTNRFSTLPSLFEKEKDGLLFLAQQNKIRTVKTIEYALVGDTQFLLLEWIEPGNKTKQFWKNFGQQLAALHSISNDQFGFSHDNYMGALPQSNTYTDKWVDFFINNRLEPQVRLAIENGRMNPPVVENFNRLYKKLDAIFPVEKPSLLHGDLWSGNFLCDENEQPVLIDPAVYFGHRSIDLGMTTLFGGFDQAFYSSYDYHFPFPPNYRGQWEVCNLYPLLIHLNLFGISYLRDIELILKKFAG